MNRQENSDFSSDEDPIQDLSETENLLSGENSPTDDNESEDDSPQDPADINELLSILFDVIARLPRPLRDRFKRRLDELSEMIRDARPPRIAIIGRRGSGKTTLINAMFGRAQSAPGPVRPQTGASHWVSIQHNGLVLDVLDTRGLHEGINTEEAVDAQSAEESIKMALEDKCPDLLIFTIKAKEVASAIDADLNSFQDVYNYIHDKLGIELPVIGVVTQCDELEPVDEISDFINNKEKMTNVNDSVRVLRQKISEIRFLEKQLVDVIPTVGYVRIRQDLSFDKSKDRRWNIDELLNIMAKEVPKEAKLNTARMGAKQIQYHLANKVIEMCTIASAAVGLQPIPVADMPVLLAIQTAEIGSIMYLGGQHPSFASIRRFLASIGISGGIAFVLRSVVRGLRKFIPGGSIISSGVAAAGTYGVGKASIAYFIDGVSAQEAKDIYDKYYKPLKNKLKQKSKGEEITTSDLPIENTEKDIPDELKID